jgi:hypothetical protein
MRASRLAAAAVLFAATSACASPGAEGETDEEPEREVPLELAVDSVDIVHGALRVIATMTDGSADVSVRLGGDCDQHETGGGLSTTSTLAWTFGEDDLADAIDCGLVVRARVRTGRRYVTKRTDLAVSASVTPSAAEPTDSTEEDTPAHSSQSTSFETIDLARAALLGRNLIVDGVACVVSLDVGGTTLQSEP